MKLEVGKKYKNSRGDIIEIVKTGLPGDRSCLGAIISGDKWWAVSYTDAGAFFGYNTATSNMDLISEHIEPEVYEFECEWYENDKDTPIYPFQSLDCLSKKDVKEFRFSSLVGKRTKVRVEVLG